MRSEKNEIFMMGDEPFKSVLNGCSEKEKTLDFCPPNRNWQWAWKNNQLPQKRRWSDLSFLISQGLGHPAQLKDTLAWTLYRTRHLCISGLSSHKSCVQQWMHPQNLSTTRGKPYMCQKNLIISVKQNKVKKTWLTTIIGNWS